MAEPQHSFTSTIAWEQARRGRAEVTGRAPVAVGAPSEFGGTDDVWSPEHLTVAAVNACLMLTFIAVAENSKVAFTSYASTATATLGKVEGRGTAITKIVVRPRITVPADSDRNRLDRVLQLAKKNCFISNSLSSEVSLEADIVAA
jgi:organic hydroperoxide reductase OsmC/OhrA